MSDYAYRPPSGIPPPDARVMGLENVCFSLGFSNLNLTEQAFPQRPGFGTQGNKVSVWANFVELLVDPKLVLYMYRIEVEPKAVGKKLGRILKLFFDGPDCAPVRGKIATDFKSTMVAFAKQPDGNFNIRYRSEGEDEPDQRATVYHIRVRYTKTLPVADFLSYLDPTKPTGNYEKESIIQAFNVVLNHFSKSSHNLITIGSRTFPLGENGNITDLGAGLQAIRGFYSSVRASTGRILVNVNVSYGVFFQPGPLHILIKLVARSSQDKYKLDRSLRGLSVKVMHLSKRNKSGGQIPRMKTILGLASATDGMGLGRQRPRVLEFGAGPKAVEFWLEDQKRYITVYDFFQLRKLFLSHFYPPLDIEWLKCIHCRIRTGVETRGTAGDQRRLQRSPYLSPTRGL